LMPGKERSDAALRRRLKGVVSACIRMPVRRYRGVTIASSVRPGS